jgi:hypothetical protein
MTALQVQTSLVGNTAILTVSPSVSGHIMFTPVQETWTGCQTHEEANQCGELLAIAIASAMLDAIASSAKALPSQQSSGFVVTPAITVPDLSILHEVVIDLPQARSVPEANHLARRELLQTAIDTTKTYDGSLSLFAAGQFIGTLPLWAEALYQRWTW